MWSKASLDPGYTVSSKRVGIDAGHEIRAVHAPCCSGTRAHSSGVVELMWRVEDVRGCRSSTDGGVAGGAWGSGMRKLRISVSARAMPRRQKSRRLSIKRMVACSNGRVEINNN